MRRRTVRRFATATASALTALAAVFGTAALRAAAQREPAKGATPAAVPTASDAEKIREARARLRKLGPVPRSARIRVVARHGYAVVYNSVDEVAAQADLIVVGTPLEDFLDRDHLATYGSDGMPEQTVTEGRFRVLRVLRAAPDLAAPPGGVPPVIPVVEHVGLTDRPEAGLTKRTFEDYREMRRGSTYVLFLRRNLIGSFAVIGLNYGKYNIDGTDPQDDPITAATETGPTKKQAFKAEVLRRYRALIGRTGPHG